jgi:hypothetical protein
MAIADFKVILIQLAENLIPINDWLESKLFDPHDLSWWADTDISSSTLTLPWRNNSTDALFHILLVEGFLRFISSTSQQEITIVELSSLATTPLAKCPIENVETWRKTKGLDKDPSFAGASAFNFPVDSSGNALQRELFYESVLPVFQEALENTISDSVSYSQVISDLWDDKISDWSSNTIKSSIFLKQFLTDLIIVAFRSDVKDNPIFMLWRRLIPIECGEHRRSGNKFDEAQIQLAVTQIQELIFSRLKA